MNQNDSFLPRMEKMTSATKSNTVIRVAREFITTYVPGLIFFWIFFIQDVRKQTFLLSIKAYFKDGNVQNILLFV